MKFINFYRLLFICMAALCLFDTCSNDTLFNADKKQWSVPFAFVTDSNLTITLADSANPDLKIRMFILSG